MSIDTARIEAAVSELLVAIGEDPTREGLLSTPKRIAQAYTEFFSGLGVDPLTHLRDSVAGPSRVAGAPTSGTETAGAPTSGTGGTFPEEARQGRLEGLEGHEALGELVLLRDIEFRSMCEHHLLPFTGVAHVAYIPADRIVGLGRLPRVVDTLASRPQLQERLTEEIADALQTGLEPQGVLVVLDAVHGCVSARGVRQVGSSTVTLASRGKLSDPVQRAEILALIGAGGSR